MEIRKALREKLYAEIHEYKDDILKKNKEDIIESVFEMDQHIIIYEVLLDSIETFPDEFIEKLLNEPLGAISSIYQAWIKEHGDSYDEIKKYILEEVV